MSERLVLGTRGSALALWQARHVASRLKDLHPGLVIEERILQTEGDVDHSKPIAAGDRGVFVRRIEKALLDGEIDVAVHSLKDLPTTQPDGLTIAAVPERHDPRDALLTRDGRDLAGLEPGARIATGSPRRIAQLLAVRTDLVPTGIRGNVDTRVRMLCEGRFEGLILALAGIERLQIDAAEIRPIDRTVCVPAVGQGALAIECRSDDGASRERLAPLQHRESRIAVDAERAFLRRLGGGCLAPATCHATVDGDAVTLSCVVGRVDGSRLLQEQEGCTASEADALGEELARRLLAAGADRLLAEARAAAEDGI